MKSYHLAAEHRWSYVWTGRHKIYIVSAVFIACLNYDRRSFLCFAILVFSAHFFSSPLIPMVFFYMSTEPKFAKYCILLFFTLPASTTVCSTWSITTFDFPDFPENFQMSCSLLMFPFFYVFVFLLAIDLVIVFDPALLTVCFIYSTWTWLEFINVQPLHWWYLSLVAPIN